MTFNFKDSQKEKAISELETLIEEAQENNDSIDVTIKTENNYEVMGAILEFFDENEIEHIVESGGVIKASLE